MPNKQSISEKFEILIFRTPPHVRFWLAVALIASVIAYPYFANLYDTNQLEERLKNHVPNNWIEKCLIAPYKKINEFEYNFKLQLERTYEERIASFGKPIEASHSELDSSLTSGFGGLVKSFERSTAKRAAEILDSTNEGRRYTNLLYDAYRKYCIMEEACGDGRYGEYKSCMINGPIWSNSDWEYPIMWHLTE